MKKKKIMISIIVIVIIILAPYIFVETNTIIWGENFENSYKQTNMIGGIAYYKVFYCIKGKAKIYYVEQGHSAGHYVWFEKKNEKWKMTKWETVWSEYGSASGITIPYYR